LTVRHVTVARNTSRPFHKCNFAIQQTIGQHSGRIYDPYTRISWLFLFSTLELSSMSIFMTTTGNDAATCVGHHTPQVRLQLFLCSKIHFISLQADVTLASSPTPPASVLIHNLRLKLKFVSTVGMTDMFHCTVHDVCHLSNNGSRFFEIV
jgi:hypothetical protein